jgi:hypothetical protein
MHFRSLSILSDQLLSQVAREPGRPHYTEATFERKLARCRQRAPRLPPGSFDVPYDFLLAREWAAIIGLAGLTRRQMEVLILRLQGRSFEEIGGRFGHSKQGSASILRQAVVKLRRTEAGYPFVGLASVYREETRRR